MSSEQLAGLIGALGTFFVGLYGAYRLAKADKYKASSDNAAILLTGWKELQQSIAQEVERVKKSCQEEIASLKREHQADKEEWDKEKAQMKEEIETLKAQVFALMESKREARESTRKSDKEK